jgi:hypothetical protein
MRNINKKLLSLLFFLFYPATVFAAPVVMATVGWVTTSIYAWACLHPVIAAITAISIAYSIKQAHDLDKARNAGRYASNIIDNTFSNEEIVPIVYGGPIVCGGNIIWQSDPATTVKRFLVLSVGEIDSVNNVEIDDTPISDCSGCSYTLCSGSSSQSIDSRGAGIVKGLHDVAYLALTLKSGEKVSGNPIVAAEVTGRKVKTWNTGTQSWDTNSLAASSNPAAIIRDYLTLSKVLGGCGLSEDFVDNGSFGDFYDYCGELIDDGRGGTEARYELDIIIDTKHSAIDTIDHMLITCGASLIHSADKYKIAFAQSESVAVQAFTESNIKKGSFSYGYGKSEETPNKVIVEWISPFETKNSKRTEMAEDELDQTIRGTVEEKIEMYGVTRQSQASRMAKKILYDKKINDVWCEFEVNDMSALHCEPGDVVSVTHSIPNWTAGLFTINEITEVDYGRCKLLLQAYNSSVHDDRYGATFDDWDYGSPENPYDPVTDVTGIVLTEVGWRNADGVHIAHIDVEWTEPASGLERLNGYIIELSKSSGDFITVGSVSRLSTSYRININLEINKEYVVKIKTQSIYDIISDGTSSDPIGLVGKDAPPSAVTAFVVKKYRDMLICKWTKVSDVDVNKYEIRKGSSWDSAGIVQTPIYGDECQIRDIRLGVDQSYWIKSIDNSGNYSTNAKEAIISIESIPFQNIVLEIEENTAWGGTLVDCSIVDVNIELDADHLTGTYTTGVKDIGYICDARIIIQNVVSVAQALAWDSDPLRAFDDSTTLRWTGEELPGALTFQIKTSDDNITWSAWEDWISADYSCRYFQIQATLTRDSLSTSLLWSEFIIKVDIPDVDETGDGEVTVAATGDEITFTKTFHEPPVVNINITSGTGYAVKFSVNPSITGFTVKLYQLDGTAVIGTFTWSAHGI